MSLLYPAGPGAASSSYRRRRSVHTQTVHSVGKSLHPQHAWVREWDYLTVRAPHGVGGRWVGRDLEKKCVCVGLCTLLLDACFVTPNPPPPPQVTDSVSCCSEDL